MENMILKEFQLTDTKALVTGHNDVTRSITKLLEEAGAEVVSTNISSPLAQMEIQQLVDRAYLKLGRIDVLVNGIQADLRKACVDISVEEWREILDINLTLPFLFSKFVARYMLAQRRGKIINLCSALACRGLANSAAFCASLGGVRELTRALAIEWAPYNIQVNAVAPGWLEGWDVGLEPEALERLKRFIPVKHLGKSSDISPVVLYLASEASDFITGQTLFVDGGVLVRP